MAKDYYKTLGVDRKASVADIKKAYRKLARKCHPDLNPGDKNAEARFKEIQEANSVLSDPKKKSQYDKFGFVGHGPGPGAYQQGRTTGGFEGFNFSDFGSSSFRDFFDNIMGGAGAGRAARRAPVRGQDLMYTMKVGFSDVGNGIQTRIRLTRMVACNNCKGQGHVQTGGSQACPACGGSGRTSMQSGSMRFATACRACGGSGQTRGPECPACHGMGLIQKTERIKVRIPAGVDNGSRVRLAGKGNAGEGGGPTGDLYIVIEVTPHKLFKREGSNVHIRVPITVPEATLGAKIEVPTLYGKTTIKIPPGTKSGQKFRLRDKGIARPGKSSRGNQFVEVYIVPPSFNNERVRELMRELQAATDEDPRKDLGIE
jgi:molecular chaperone DnaJ